MFNALIEIQLIVTLFAVTAAFATYFFEQENS